MSRGFLYLKFKQNVEAFTFIVLLNRYSVGRATGRALGLLILSLFLREKKPCLS